MGGGIHNAYPCMDFSHGWTKGIQRDLLLSVIKHSHDVGELVDSAVIQHCDIIGARKCVHLVQEFIYKFLEVLGVVRTFNNIQRNYSINDQCWED